MEIEKTMENAVCTVKKTGKKMAKKLDFVKGLSIKNKLSYDFQLKSDKSVFPICRHSFGLSKELRLMPIIYGALAFLAVMLTCCVLKIKMKMKKEI